MLRDEKSSDKLSRTDTTQEQEDEKIKQLRLWFKAMNAILTLKPDVNLYEITRLRDAIGKTQEKNYANEEQFIESVKTEFTNTNTIDLNSFTYHLNHIDFEAFKNIIQSNFKKNSKILSMPLSVAVTHF